MTTNKSFYVKGDIIQLELRSSNGKTFFKNSCSVNDPKRLEDMFRMLNDKFGIPVTMKKHEKYF